MVLSNARGVSMTNIRIIIEYNGYGFHGWQKQDNLRTVQSELERAIKTVLRREIGPLHASGRTDAGVHARAQVVSFKTDGDVDLWKLSQGVSHVLAPELAIIDAAVVPDSFHPGRCAKEKQYSYHVSNRSAPAVLGKGRVWHVPRNLNRSILHDAAAVVQGRHDFTSFRAADCSAKNTIKEIFDSRWIEQGDGLIYQVIGEGFLKQMVRNLVGTMVWLANGKINDRTMRQILDAKDRQIAGVTAPPWGLFLDWVRYD